MPKPVSSPYNSKSGSGFYFCGENTERTLREHGESTARTQSVDSYTDKATRMPDPETTISESKDLTTCKRQRNRKLSNPQRRLKHVDTRQNLHVSEGTYPSPEKQMKSSATVSTNQLCFRSSQDEHKLQEPTHAESSQEKVGEDYDDAVKDIKTETVHGFIVDQWYDLGPSPHKDGHSPAPATLLEVEKRESKEYPEESSDIVTSQTDSSTDIGSKWSRMASNITTETLDSDNTRDRANNLQMVHLGKVDSSANNNRTTMLTEQNSITESRAVIDLVDTSHTRTFPVTSSFLRCPFPNVSTSSSFHQHTFPLPLHAASPYFHSSASINSFSHENTSNTFTVTPSGIYSYVTSLGLTKPAVAYSYVRFESDRPGAKQYPEKEVAGLFEPTNQHEAASVTNTSLVTFASTDVVSSTSESVPIPTVAGNIFSTSYPRFSGNVPYQSLLYPNNLYPNGLFQPSCVVIVPSPAFYVQHMPYLTALPAANYSQSHTAMSDVTPYVDSGLQTSGDASNKADVNLKTSTCTQTHPFVRIPSPKMASPLVTDSRPGTGDDHCTRRDASSKQHHSRAKVKSKMATSADFIDPTRIKFGVDDVDSDDDVSKLNDVSDCSDKEWQPNKKHEKITGWRDSATDDGWTPSGINESDSPIKRTYVRRRKRSSKEPAECEECGKVFQGIYYLRRHQMSHSDIRPYQCETCQKSFKQKAHLIGHLTVHDRALKERPVNIKDPNQKSKPVIVGSRCPGRPKKTYTDKELACKECGKAFKTVYRLKRHELSHTDVRPFSCRICGKGFKQTGHRNEHEANHEKTKKRFLCNLCGVVFRSRSSFNNHMRSHGTEKLRLQATKGNMNGCCGENKAESGEVGHTGYDCPYCTEKFATAQALNNHLETHVEVQQRRHVQPYSCDVCRRAFTYRHNLIKHKLVHKAPDKFVQFYQEKVDAHVASGKPSFKCGMCAKVFIRKETLAKHFKIHSGNKPFKCLICSREFTQNVHLKVHMRKHTGSRPFQCKECNRSFIDSTALAKHIEYEACNTDNCLYHCKICDKLHYYMGSLKQHIRKKHNIKEEEVETYILKSERSNKRKVTSEGEKHPCKVCSSNFSEKCNLVRHIRRKHAGLVELLQKELEIKSANNLANETIQNDNMDKCGVDTCGVDKRSVDTFSDEDKGSEDKCNDEDKGSESDKDCQGNLKGTTNWSNRETVECNVTICGVNANRDVDVIPRQLTIDEDVCEGSVCTDSSQACMSQPVEATSINTIDVSNSSQCEDWVSEASAVRDVDNLDISDSPFAEHSDWDLKLKCAEAEEERADVFLEGFRMTDLPLSERHLCQPSVQEYFFCKDECCTNIPDSRCRTGERDYLFQRDLRAPLSKDTVDENFSSPTDINFLYNIGLIVSNKAKLSRDSSVKRKSDSHNSNCSTDAYSPPDESCLSFGKDAMLHSHETDDQILMTHDKNLLADYECCRPDGVVSRDATFTPKTITGPSKNGSGEYFLNIESKRNLNLNFPDEAGKEIINPRTPPEERSNYDDKPDKHHFNLRGDHDIPEESLLPDVDNNYQSINNRCSLKSMEFISGGGDTETGSYVKNGPHDSLVCQIDDSDCPASLSQQVETNVVDSILMAKTTPTDEVQNDICVTSKTQEHIILLEKDKHGKIMEDNSGHPRIKDQSINLTEVAGELLPGSLTFLARKQVQEVCQSLSELDDCSSSAKPETAEIHQAQLHPSLVTSSELQPSSKTREGPQTEPTLLATELLSPSLGLSNCLSWADEVPAITSVSRGVNPRSDVTWQSVKQKSDLTDLESAIKDSTVAIREQLTGNMSDQNKCTASVARLESTKDPTQSTSTHNSYYQLDCKLKSSEGTNKAAKNVISRMSTPDSSRNEYEACPSESHLKYLGLLACKDAQAIKNKAIPLKDLYETYKPWLEDLIHKTRPRKTRTNKAQTSCAENKDNGTYTADSTSLQIQTQLSPPANYTADYAHSTEKHGNCLLWDNTETKVSIESDNARQSHSQPNILKRKRRYRKEEISTNQEKIKELSQTMTTVELSHLKGVYESEHYQASISSPDHQFLNTSTLSLASSTTHPQREASNSVPTTTAAKTSCPNTEPESRSTTSQSPPSTPDTTVKGRHLYSCTVCNKYFTARHQLKRHELSHTNHRPYNCEQCGRAFRQKVHLSDHVKRHQGQRPFMCAGCGKRFVLKNEMNQHVKNHCRATVDVLKGPPVIGDKNICSIPVNELNHVTCAPTPAALRKLDSKNFIVTLRQSMQPSDVM